MSDEERRAEAVSRSLAFLEAIDDPKVLELHDIAAQALSDYQDALEAYGVAEPEVITQSMSIGVMTWLHRHA